MPRTRSATVAVRNDQIYALWKQSRWSLPALAEKFSLTPRRVAQIIADFHPELDEDVDRGVMRGTLWNLIDDLQQIIAAPGYKLAPNGRLAEDNDGKPIEDIMARIEAIKVTDKVVESLRRLGGRDRQVDKKLTVEFTLAQQQAMEDIARRRAEMQAAGVIPGEVVRELPAAGA